MVNLNTLPINVITGNPKKLLKVARFLAYVFTKSNPVSVHLKLTEHDLYESKKPACLLKDTSAFTICKEDGTLLLAIMSTPLKNLEEALEQIPNPPSFAPFDQVAAQCPIPRFLYEQKSMFLFGMGKLPIEDGGLPGGGLRLSNKALDFARNAGFESCCACLSSEGSQRIFLDRLGFIPYSKIAYAKSKVAQLEQFPGEYIVAYKKISMTRTNK